jgi:hypothetical protein
MKPKPKNRFIILYAILTQGITSLFVLASQEPLRVANLGFFYQTFSDFKFGAVLMLIATLLALAGFFAKGDGFRFLLFLPQLGFLLLTSSSAIYHISQGHYADGVMKSWQFIFVDQMPAIVATLLYTFAIFDFEKEEHDRT